MSHVNILSVLYVESLKPREVNVPGAYETRTKLWISDPCPVVVAGSEVVGQMPPLEWGFLSSLSLHPSKCKSADLA